MFRNQIHQATENYFEDDGCSKISSETSSSSSFESRNSAFDISSDEFEAAEREEVTINRNLIITISVVWTL